MLEEAHGDCLDRVLEAVQKYAREDLPAAYFIRAQRKADAVDFLRALDAANQNQRSDRGRFNRALTLEKLGLVSEAINAWNRTAREESAWSDEAILRRDALRRLLAVRPSAKTPDYSGAPETVVARYTDASFRFAQEDVLPLLDPIATYDGPGTLRWRIPTLRAGALENLGRYTEALEAYDRALTNGDLPARAAVFTRRSANRLTTGDAAEAFRDAFRTVSLLQRVTDLNTHVNGLNTAADAAWELGYHDTALLYRNAAVAAVDRAAGPAATLKHYRSIALRARAGTLIELGRDSDATSDLQSAADLAEAIGNLSIRNSLRMRVHDVRGQLQTKQDPAAAVRSFTEAIALAGEENSTYRAVLHFERAAAREAAHDPRADEDIATALQILKQEAMLLLNKTERGAYEDLWIPYFSRFQPMYQRMIETRLASGDAEAAFVYSEQARAFEPLHLLFQSQPVPPAFRKIETVDDLRDHLARLPADTVLLQYAVLEQKTYAFVLTRDGVEAVAVPVHQATIERWVKDINDAVQRRQPQEFTRVMRAAYALVGAPLARPSARARKHLVIVPDGPMHGLPFAGLEGARGQGRLIERGSIAVAGSTSLYLYALHRDAQFAPEARPRVLIAGDPVTKRAPLPHAKAEAQQLAEDYADATLLLRDDATVRRFLEAAKSATIIHFAGHSLANPKRPWHSLLALTAQRKDSGELTAEMLLTALPRLDRTRLVVLAACSTAGGQPIGPEGLAPLVRPLIAANVPAVAGTLWDVKDATAKNLMVSLHCHYRNGDDVAAALQRAQLEMLRANVPAMYWAPFQVVGHAGSPYERPVAMEKTHNDQLCTENSLHRPDGLHSQ